MIWLIFSILGAFFQATYFAFVKKLAKTTDERAIPVGIFLIAGIVLLISSYINGFPRLGSMFFIGVLVVLVIDIIMVHIYIKALKISDISNTIPLLSFTPVFLLLTSYIILGEFPSLLGLVGILVVVIGAYILGQKTRGAKEKPDFLMPIKNLTKNKGSVYILIMALLASISFNFLKIAVQNSDPIFAPSIIILGSFVFFSGKSIWKKVDIFKNYKGKYILVILAGLCIAILCISQNTALKMQITPYVVSVLRMSAIVSVIYGCLFFKEKTFLYRFIGSIIMVLGVMLISFS